MRKTKLDKRSSAEVAVTQQSESLATSGGEAPAPRLALQKADFHREPSKLRARLARLLKVDLRLATIAASVAGVTAFGVSTCIHRRDIARASPRCLEISKAERWEQASAVCAEEAARTEKSAAGVRAADALLRLGRYREASAAAQRWFGSEDDATARQIAGFSRNALGERAEGLRLLRRALAGHLAREDYQEAARDSWYLASVLAPQKLLGEALEAAEDAVHFAERVEARDVRTRLRGKALLTLGKVQGEIGDLKAARKSLWEAQQALAPSPRDQSQVFLQLGIFLHESGEQASAATLLERALELAVETREGRVITAARLNLARVRRELGELDAAELQMGSLDKATRALTTALFVEGLIASDRGERERADRLLVQAAARATADYPWDIAYQRGAIAERFGDERTAERRYRQAIGFVEELRQSTRSLELRPWILARRRRPYQQLLDLLARQDRGVEALEIAERLHASTWSDAIKRRGPRAARLDEDAAPMASTPLEDSTVALPGHQLLALLRGRDALIFTETESGLWRFHIQNGALAELEKLPEQSLPLIERWRDTPDDLALAAELGALLIPSQARAETARPLYLVTSDALAALPFAALRPGPRYLAEDRAISRLPGIAALRCRAPDRGWTSKVFLGDSREDLPFARQETLALAHQVGGVAFLGAEVTRQRLEASEHAELLHLAVHANADSAGARLLLAGQMEISAAEIVNLQIGPRVAVLAGCATAASRDTEGWGALSSAFLAAGSRSVIATLQAVPDDAPSEIMRWFYAFDGARRPAQALARAQRQLLAQAPAAPPSTWARFVAYGSGVADDCEI